MDGKIPSIICAVSVVSVGKSSSSIPTHVLTLHDQCV